MDIIVPLAKASSKQEWLSSCHCAIACSNLEKTFSALVVYYSVMHY